MNRQRLGRPATAALPANQVRQLPRPGVRQTEIAPPLQIGRTSGPASWRPISARN